VNNVILDVGFGFGKSLDQNYELLRNLSIFKRFEKPLLVGISRKSMLYRILNSTPERALNATTVAHTLALLNGADMLRVHDVKEAKEVVEIIKKYVV
jgi:dihydropteroate synthase